MRTTTPARLKTLAIERYEASTGKRWSKASRSARETWLAKTEPLLRKEEGIAADAVWRDGAWQPAEQIDLFSHLETGREVA